MSKATIDSMILEKELKSISGIVKKNTTLPILTCAFFEFTKDNLKITVTDLETTAITSLKCKCEKPFNLIVECADILDVCSRISEPITITGTEKNILIKSNEANVSLPRLNDEKIFPKTIVGDAVLEAEVNGDFFYALNNANSCRHKNYLMVNFNMACVDFKKDSIVVVGTDGLHLYSSRIDVKPTGLLNVMIPDSFVSLTKSFQDSKLLVNEKWITVEYGSKIIHSRLSENKFADYDKIISYPTIYNFTVNRSDLISKLQIAGVASSMTTNICVINFTEEGIVINSQDIDFGKQADVKHDVKHDVKIDSICINGNLMLHILNLLNSETVKLSFTAENFAVFVRPENDDSIKCMIQPLVKNF
jgi:DNA polymerase III subunit beta